MIKRLFGSTVEILEKGLSLRAKRQAVLASNVANADTPGYKAKDLDFKRLMKRFMEKELQMNVHGRAGQKAASGRLELAVTNPGHMRPARDAEIDAGIIVSDETGIPNNVDLDLEMARLSENSIQYQTTLQLLIKKFEGLKNAATEGGRA